MLGDRIRKMRKSKGLTQQDLGDHLQLAKSTISQYETGTNEPDAKTMSRLADLLGCTTDYLLGRIDEPLTAVPDGITPEEREFLKWVDENLENSFFYDFDKSPEDSKREMMETLRFIWEPEKKRQGRDK